MIVVDTNVLAYLVIEGDQTPEAEALLASDPEWAAPRLRRSELANVLALYVRRGEMSVAEAIQRHEAAGALVQGAEFVVLAQDLRVRLATADRALVRALPGVEVALKDAG